MRSLFGDRPALRHKDFGIWQTWTWAQLLDEVRAYAVGLHRLGVERGDAIAIVGANRPRLYCDGHGGAGARRHPGAGLCRRGGRRTGLRAGARRGRGSPSSRTRSRSTRSCPCPIGCRSSSTIIYDEPQGLRDYDHASLHAIDDVIADGRAALAARSEAAAVARRRDRRGQGRRHLVILYTSGTTGQSKGVMLSARALHRRRLRHGRVRQAHRPGRGAGLPADGLGRRPLSQLRAGPDRGLLHGLPGEPRDRDRRICARSGRPTSSRRRACSRTCSPAS